MASPQEDAPVSTKQQPSSDRETNGSPPRRPDMGTGCALLCFHLPSRPRKNKKKKPGPLAKLGPGGKIAREPADDCYYASAAAASQRVTFLASASLSTWWPSSPSASAASGNDGVWRRSSSVAAARGGGAGARMRALSSSFSYWRRSQTSSSRVMPHGAADHHQSSARLSFSFPSSPVSVSSCLSTPRISHGCHRE